MYTHRVHALLWTLLLFSITLIHSQTLREGPCTVIPTIQDFDHDQFLGRYYEFERTFQIVQQPIICVRSHFTIEDGLIVEFTRAFNTSSDEVIEVRFTSTFPEDEEPGSYWEYYSPIAECTGQHNYFRVIKTDYLTYQAGYYCQELETIDRTPYHTFQMWIFTRDSIGIPDNVRYAIYGYMADLGLEPDLLFPVSQACPDSMVNTNQS